MLNGWTDDKLGFPLIKCLYLVQKSLAQGEPDSKQLSTALCTASGSICQIISAIHNTGDQRIGSPPINDASTALKYNHGVAVSLVEESFECGFLAVRQAFPCLLKGLLRLESLPEGPPLRGQVIWGLINILGETLNQICNLCATHVRQVPNATPKILETRTKPQRTLTATSSERSLRSPKRNPCLACKQRHRKCDGRAPNCRNCEYWKVPCERGSQLSTSNEPPSSDKKSVTRAPETALRLCELTITMLKRLDTTQASQAEVIEGFTFLLFRRVGDCLRSFVFEDAEDDPKTTSDHEIATSPQVLEAQAPCLIWLLSQVQSLATNPHQSLQPAELLPNPQQNP